MDPPFPAAIIALATRWLQNQVPFKTMSITARHPLGERSTAGTVKFPAALLTRMSTAPKRRDDHRVDRLDGTHVGRNAEGVPAGRLDLRDGRRDDVGTAARDRHVRAEPGEFERHRLPEPGAAAGDDRGLPAQGVRRKHRFEVLHGPHDSTSETRAPWLERLDFASARCPVRTQTTSCRLGYDTGHDGRDGF
jgi:hypothetical protein